MIAETGDRTALERRLRLLATFVERVACSDHWELATEATALLDDTGLGREVQMETDDQADTDHRADLLGRLRSGSVVCAGCGGAGGFRFTGGWERCFGCSYDSGRVRFPPKGETVLVSPELADLLEEAVGVASNPPRPVDGYRSIQVVHALDAVAKLGGRVAALDSAATKLLTAVRLVGRNSHSGGWYRSGGCRRCGGTGTWVGELGGTGVCWACNGQRQSYVAAADVSSWARQLIVDGGQLDDPSAELLAALASSTAASGRTFGDLFDLRTAVAELLPNLRRRPEGE